MKKLVLTFVALVAMATTSFAQFSSITSRDIDNFLNSYSSSSFSYNLPSVSYSVPSVSYSVPKVTYSVPKVTYNVPSSSVNLNTTTVSGYNRSDGTYVQSHVRSMPNSTNWDNYSTKGNSNPFTGSTGYRAKDYTNDAYNYGAGHTIHTGSRGGQYYYNSNGNKTYVPKRNMW